MKRLQPLGAAVLAGLCLLSFSADAESVVHARKGGTAELACSLSLPTDGTMGLLYVVEWVRQDSEIPVLIKFGAYAPRVHPDYEGRVSLIRGKTLRVEGVLLEDEGRYECRILLLDKLSDETRNGTWTQLSVSAPPAFTETPPPVQEALLGGALKLRCVARGNPPPTITWTKDGAPADQLDDVVVLNGTLSFLAVGRDSTGLYQCHAFNTEGNASHMTQLMVKGPPVIAVPPKDTTLNMSQNALLQCRAEADPPNMTYVWRRNGENVHHTEGLKSRVKILVDGTLKISRLTPEDSGKYTCMPTNGLLTPPTASATLTVRHPAQVHQMPKRAFLPTGMRGVISCPVRAEPPLLRVDWTKDGQPLDLGKYPGWTLTSEGSLLLATANDDAVGVYTCTPYNSYGTMGQSKPTTAILQDPPTFQTPPRKEYRQQVGRTLVIPCRPSGDPAPKVTWVKTAPSSRALFTVAANGSLVLQPLSKDHQGAWKCTATNRAASVSVGTLVLVLGTSPHAVAAVSVLPGTKQANVSWEGGFDGGYTQKFTVWWRQVSTNGNGSKPDWVSLSEPRSGTSALVTGLQPGTQYQFSVLAHNKLGSGPFSEITTSWTLDAPLETRELAPPTLVSVNVTAEGLFLLWRPPPSRPVNGFVLQWRPAQGDWATLADDISAEKSELLLQGLHKDCVYELRMLSRRGAQLSLPSQPLNVSTMGMDVYPASSRLLEQVPKPLLAGIIGGVGLLSLVLLLAVGTVCVIGHRGNRHKKQTEDLSPALCQSPSVNAGSSAGSPDSVLKQKLLPHHPSSRSSSSSQSDRSSLDSLVPREPHAQRQQLFPRASSPPPGSLPETYLHRHSLPASSPLEFIYRGPDGRFIAQPHMVTTTATALMRRDLRRDSLRPSGGNAPPLRKTQSLRSTRDERNGPAFVLSVDLPGSGTDHARQTERHLSLQGSLCAEQEQNRGRATPDGRDSALDGPPGQGGFAPGYLSLKRGSTRSTTSTLVLQMEHEREQGNLNRCLTLAREREMLERELRRYTGERQAEDEETTETLVREGTERRDMEERGLAWGGGLRQPYGSLDSRGRCSSRHGRAARPPLSCGTWEARPVSPATGPVSRLNPLRGTGSAATPTNDVHFESEHNQRLLSSFSEDHSYSDLRLQHTAERPYWLAQGGGQWGGSAGEDLSKRHTGMNVDEPQVQSQLALPAECTTELCQPQEKHRPNLSLLEGDSPGGGGRGPRGFELRRDERVSSQSSRALFSGEDHTAVLRKTHSLGHQNRLGLRSPERADSRKPTKDSFLAPEAWIDSLGLRDSSVSPYAIHPGSAVEETPNDVIAEDRPRLDAADPSPDPSVPSPPPPAGLRRPSAHFTDASLGESELHHPPASRNISPADFTHANASWPSVLRPYETAQERNGQESAEEEGEEEGQEVDMEIGGYRPMAEPEGSYHSYASQSSGRGSLDPPTSRQSFSLSPPPRGSSDATEEEEEEEEEEQGRDERTQQQDWAGRRVSVDEGYEWDAAGSLPQSEGLGTRRRTGILGGFLREDLKPPHKAASILPPPRGPLEVTKEIKLISSGNPDQEPDAVLF